MKNTVLWIFRVFFHIARVPCNTEIVLQNVRDLKFPTKRDCFFYTFKLSFPRAHWSIDDVERRIGNWRVLARNYQVWMCYFTRNGTIGHVRRSINRFFIAFQYLSIGRANN